MKTHKTNWLGKLAVVRVKRLLSLLRSSIVSTRVKKPRASTLRCKELENLHIGEHYKHIHFINEAIFVLDLSRVYLLTNKSSFKKKQYLYIHDIEPKKTVSFVTIAKT